MAGSITLSEVALSANGTPMRPEDPASHFRSEFRYRETRFLALKARRAAIVMHLPWWLHWVLPPVRRSRFWLLAPRSSFEAGGYDASLDRLGKIFAGPLEADFRQNIWSIAEATRLGKRRR